MEVFLVFASLVFLIFGSLFLLSPETVRKICNLLNKTAFAVDEKMHAYRRIIGVIFLCLSIFCWHLGFLR